MFRVIGAAAGLLVAMSVSTAQAAEVRCQMVEIASLPITMHGSQPIIDMEINGRPARMLVDTGSAVTLLWRSAAPKFGIQELTRSTQKLYGVGGGSEISEVTLQEMKLDKTVAHNVHVLISGEGAGFDSDGLLGADFLSVTDVEFDFAGGAVRLFQPRNCNGDQVVYWGKAYSVLPILPANGGRDIVVTALLNGRPVRATLDTGASTSVVTTGTAEQVGVTPKSQGVTRIDKSGGIGSQRVETYEGVFPSFSFGDETIRNARLRIADLFNADKEVEIGTHIPTSVIDQPRMLLGADFFRAHRVYIARSQNRVYVSYLGGPVFEVPQSGVPVVTPSAPPSGR